LPSGLAIDTAKLAGTSIPLGTAYTYRVVAQSQQDRAYSIIYNSSNTVVIAKPLTATNLLGSDVIANAEIHLKFSVPIVGWTSNQNAPLLVGSVTSSSAGLERIERVSFGGAGTWASGTNCTSSPCTIYTSSGGVSSVTRASTGAYSINFYSGTFSSIPTCICSLQYFGDVEGHCSFNVNGSQSATVRSLEAYNKDNATSQDSFLEVICVGPR
jgi:hypothetical protein